MKSPSEEQSGAQLCDPKGQACRPLAPGQKIEGDGIVRTLAGGEVTLDFGAGRSLDLASLSEVRLQRARAELASGDFALTTSPLVAKDTKIERIVVGNSELKAAPQVGSQVSLRTDDGQTELTLRKGALSGSPALAGLSPGQSLRLTASGAFRTAASGAELSPLATVGSARTAFAKIVGELDPPGGRGLGTMTARLPNTDQVRSGVRLKKHSVKVTIRDGYARTEVEEEFENTTPHILEGRYRFPVPAGARLSRLALWVGDELVEGEVVERQRAAQIYHSIVDRPVPRDPALLEWLSAGEMSLRVFPILPHKSRRILLAYDEALPRQGGSLIYRYPLSLGHGRENEIEDLRFGVTIVGPPGAVRVPSHPARIDSRGTDTFVAYQAKGATPREDFVVVVDEPAALQPALAFDPGRSKAAGDADGAAGHFAMRLRADLPVGVSRPDPEITDRAIVLDVSHSQSPETIALQVALVRGLLSELSPAERFVRAPPRAIGVTRRREISCRNSNLVGLRIFPAPWSRAPPNWRACLRVIGPNSSCFRTGDPAPVSSLQSRSPNVPGVPLGEMRTFAWWESGVSSISGSSGAWLPVSVPLWTPSPSVTDCPTRLRSSPSPSSSR